MKITPRLVIEAMAKFDASAAHPCMLGAIADIADAGPITRVALTTISRKRSCQTTVLCDVKHVLNI